MPTLFLANHSAVSSMGVKDLKEFEVDVVVLATQHDKALN